MFKGPDLTAAPADVFIEERLEGQGSPSEQNRVSYFLNHSWDLCRQGDCTELSMGGWDPPPHRQEPAQGNQYHTGLGKAAGCRLLCKAGVAQS